MNKKKPKKTPILDLHGCSADEIYDLVDKFIVKNTSSGLKQIHIMTGKGKGIVKKKVKEYLNQAGYPHRPLRQETGQVNEGILVIFLD